MGASLIREAPFPLDSPPQNVYTSSHPYTLANTMRTNIEIDDTLLTEAMFATGLSTKKAAVEEGLRRLVQSHRRLTALNELTGLGWEGDLATSREGRSPVLLP
jgi:Arc/MetJ family transcription regulator